MITVNETVLLDGRDTPSGVTINFVTTGDINHYVVASTPCCNTAFLLTGAIGSGEWQCQRCGLTYKLPANYRAISVIEEWRGLEDIPQWVSDWTGIPLENVKVDITWTDLE